MAANGEITVTVGITGKLLSGQQIMSVSESKEFTSISDLFQRVLTIGTTVQTLAAIGTVAGATLAALNCIYVKNLDATNFLVLGFIDTGAKSVYVKLAPGESFLHMDDKIECDDDAGGAFSAFNNADTVTLKADTADVKALVCVF
jgi:hypothetical protein